MLLLVTGASGVGKTTVRKIVEAHLVPEVEAVELGHLTAESTRYTLAWRQRTTELVLQRVLQLQHESRHLLLCGDPVAAVEAIAAPSASMVEAIAVCLLDATPDAQAARLTARGDDPSLLLHHHAFADWMRRQATDPQYMLEVVTTSGWEAMRWDRVPLIAPNWHVHVIDTSRQTPHQVTDDVLAWIRAALAGEAPVLRPSALRR